MRRTAEYVIRLAAAHAVERVKNRVLPALQDRFETAYLMGEILALEPGDIREITRITQEEMNVQDA